jgi:hypothetical protein
LDSLRCHRPSKRAIHRVQGRIAPHGLIAEYADAIA